MNILIAQPEGDTRKSFFTKKVVEKLKPMGNIVWNTSNRHFTKEELRERLKDTDVCITGWGCAQLDSYVLGKANRLKIVAHTGGSVANIASEALYDKGIRVLSGNDIYAESVAEGVIAYTLCALRELSYYDNKVKHGGWREDNFINESLLDRKVGLIGFGAVARYLVKFLFPFRCQIIVYDPFVSEEILKEHKVERVELEDVFKNSDIISLHLPQREDTYHMINKRLLSLMPDGALLVNTARGNIIDEKELITELEKGRFKAVLDVFETEPLPIDSKLRRLENVLLIPHMGGPTVDRRSYVTLKLIENINSIFKGKKTEMEIPRSYGLSMTKQ
ncbi:hydroxyacid dehydrogenase [Clostridium swellfunianum]|uniref:hydroxyacid dehydrogenase n=1 Tax=Clostridium swellfunianum TaxID=1367462 RepID=UPI00202F3C88|nr:hydroxyacid dehydrogenase [Clostridium swellfunianum]MCM0647578.1 hydroxyacid dehydrogenase [Clostridium swellfunianum]